jgi:hypothetical protein
LRTPTSRGVFNTGEISRKLPDHLGIPTWLPDFMRLDEANSLQAGSE